MGVYYLIGVVFLVLGGIDLSFTCPTFKACIELIDDKELYKNDVWLYLIHFENNKSHIDDPSFFIHKEGMRNPRLELIENVKKFLLDPSYKCRFPARALFISKEFGIPVNFNRCNNLKKFLEMLEGDEIYLIHADQYPRDLSSFFGHLFLKIGSSKDGFYMISYTADTSKGKGIFYPFKSILGFYPGYFSVTPFEEGTRKYIETQKRKLYEFKVNLSEYQKNILKKHIWELLHIKPSYYFLHGNCASSINDIILFSRKKKGAIPPWIIPTDVVTNLYERKVIEDSNETKLFHKSQKISLGFSVYKNTLTLSYRPIYHDLLDKPDGFRRGFELIASSFTFGYSRNTNYAFLDKWQIFRISYLSDLSEGISWIFDIGVKRFSGTRHSYFMYSEGGVGISKYIKDITLFSLPYVKIFNNNNLISILYGLLIQNRYVSFLTFAINGTEIKKGGSYMELTSGIGIHPHYRYSFRLEYKLEKYIHENRDLTLSANLYF